jgi:hypothetical protein
MQSRSCGSAHTYPKAHTHDRNQYAKPNRQLSQYLSPGPSIE